VNADFSMLM